MWTGPPLPHRGALDRAGAFPSGKTLLRAANPKLAFARAAEWLLPAAPIANGIHPTAIIAPSAQIAPGAAVGPYVVIEDDVRVGAGSEIGAFCFLGRGAGRGRMPPVSPRDVICRSASGEPRDPAFRRRDRLGRFWLRGQGGSRWKFPQVGEVEIRDDVEIGANTTIDRGSLDRTVIRRRRETG